MIITSITQSCGIATMSMTHDGLTGAVVVIWNGALGHFGKLDGLLIVVILIGYGHIASDTLEILDGSAEVYASHCLNEYGDMAFALCGWQ